MSVMGLDVGTTGAKAIAFDESGGIVSQAYREYPLTHPREGWIELEAELLWARVAEAIREANAGARNDPVEAVAVSAQGEAAAPVDAKGRALHPFIVTFDNRTIPQHEWWRENVGALEVYRETGMPLHPMYSINKWMWLQHNRPDIRRDVRKYLCVEDFIIYRLCGESVIDYSLASRTMAFNVTDLRWSALMLGKAGIDPELLSTPCQSGTSVGRAARGLAEELGFAAPPLVVTGGHDQACGALGAGIIRRGMAMNATGTVDVLCPAFGERALDRAMLESNYCCYPHAYPGMYISVAFNLTGGLLLRWYRDTLCRQEAEAARSTGADPYELIIGEARSEPANVFVLPHFVGAGTPTLDSRSRGAVLGLTIATGKAELTRAVLDCIAYEMRQNIERMEQCGVAIRELRAIGGGARSSRWLQMKADVFERTVTALKVSEAASLGAAMLAAVALRRFPDLDDAVDRCVRVGEVYGPDPEAHARYEPRYRTYLAIYPAVKELNRALADGAAAW